MIIRLGKIVQCLYDIINLKVSNSERNIIKFK